MEGSKRVEEILKNIDAGNLKAALEIIKGTELSCEAKSMIFGKLHGPDCTKANLEGKMEEVAAIRFAVSAL